MSNPKPKTIVFTISESSTTAPDFAVGTRMRTPIRNIIIMLCAVHGHRDTVEEMEGSQRQGCHV